MPLPPCLAVAFTLPMLAQEPTPPPAAATATAPAPAIDLTLLAGLKFRSIGPAVCSGRIGTVVSVPGDPTIVWVGGASGGVWKSTDGGVTFAPMFDDQDCTSIGAIAIDPRSPDVVWVGTGEGNPRNSASVGRGLYRTRDAGHSWQKLGLEQTEHIHRILLHPTDPDIAYVAALGTTWGESEQRGVFKTRDGGKTWDKVLYVDPRTGCGDLAMDPQNPDKLLAGMWEHRRWPWFFKSGGPGSGLHRTLDGGASWQKLEEKDGVPAGELGRIGLAFAQSDPRVVYALVEASKSALLRSDDGGFHWRTVRSGDNTAPRPFYFCDIRVDPQDANRIYSLHIVIDVSNDGGRTFDGLVGWNSAHPDHHAMWIDPKEPRRILIGNDGGVYQSQDRGASWRFCANLPLAQFYHVAVDHDLPYHVYGGLQDNGSWRGPSTVWENGGIRNLHWQEVDFGDGFTTLPDPGDSMQGYAMSQGGELIRWNQHTGERKNIQPRPPAGTELRFNWNAGLAQDPFDPRTIWLGSQFVHQSRDRGESWQVISPDLTTDNPEWQKQKDSGGLTLDATGAENHCTILSIAPSPVQRSLLWVGTDDGRVQVTRDGGQSWSSVEDVIPDKPKNVWCPHLEPSRFDAATAYAVFDDHRRANWTPYVYRTTDFGKTWTSLRTPAIDGYCLTILQDPVQKELLFLGTEFGLWLSFDGGQQWQKWKQGLPTASAMALTVQPEANDLVVATHGRSMFVLDDLAPLRTLTPELLQQKLHLFAIKDAVQYIHGQTPGSRFPGTGEYRGETVPRGAMLTLITNADELAHPDAEQDKPRKAAKASKAAAEAKAKAAEPKPADQPAAAPKPPGKEPPKDQVTVEVRAADGTLVRTFREGVKLGLNRICWRFDTDGGPGPARELQEDPELPPGNGGEAVPGDYTVTVKFQDQERSAKVKVLPDPRTPFDLAAARSKAAARSRVRAIDRELHAATQRLARSKRDVELCRQRLALEPKPKDGTEDPHKATREALDKCQKAIDELETRLYGPQGKQGIVHGQGLLYEAQENLAITGNWDPPNATELLGLDRAQQHTDTLIAAVNTFVTGPLADFITAFANSGLSLLPIATPVPTSGK